MTTIGAGTLQVGDGGGTGALGFGNVLNAGTLGFNRNNTVTIANTISGAGAVQQIGSGTTILTGANTYSGTTTIAAGTLQIGAGGTAGDLGTGAVVDHGALVFNKSNSTTVGAAITGTGSLAQIGSGLTALTAANTYTGGTTISAGTLQIGAGGTSGSLAGDVTNNAMFQFNRTDTVAFAGVVTGAGQLNQVGGGTLILTGNNNYAGATNVMSGTLQIGNGGTAGQIGLGSVALSAGTTLALNRADGLTLANPITGDGAVLQLGAGTTTFTGANGYTGLTTIAAGVLEIGSGGTTGTLGTGVVANNGALVFNRSDALIVANAIGGAGTLRKTGSGTTTLAGVSSASTTDLLAGTLSVANVLTSPVTTWQEPPLPASEQSVARS